MSNSISNPKAEDKPELSVVIPAYNEAQNIAEIYTRLERVMTQLGTSWEVVFSDDGSSDGTWDEILRLHEKNQAVKGIRLSRNFGHQYALFAGLRQASGRAIVSMDADLQHPPEVVPELVKEWRAGNKIVHTVRTDPKDFSLAKRLAARLFYRLFSFLSGVKLEPGMADFRLLDRSVVTELLQFREEGLFLRGLVQWVGYPNTRVSFQSAERFSGATKYNVRRMLKLAWHGISSFSIVPLRIGIIVGIVTSLVSFAWLVEAIYVKMVTGAAVPGWASTVGILSLLFGILFIFLGMVGEYIGRILVQVRERPLFIISDRVGLEENTTDQVSR